MTRILLSISLLIISLSAAFSQATPYDGIVYVSPDGSPSNPGTEASPRTLDAIFSNNFGPGTTIILKDGVYNIPSERYLWRKIGTEANPIKIKAQNKHMAILKGPNNYSSSDYAVFTIAGCKYLEFDGITVMHEAGSLDQSYGIRMTQAYASATDILYSEFITIKNCKVYGHGGGGISADGTDNIFIENNIVYGNCTRNQINTSGISVYKMKPRSFTYNYWGIVISGNTCYDNKCELDFYYNENGNIYSSDKPTDGNGIILDLLDDDGTPRTPYNKRILIENNLCYNNGGAGVKIYKSSGARIVNNTSYHNNTVLSKESAQTGEIVIFGTSLSPDGDYHKGIYNNAVVVNPALGPNKVYGIVVDFNLNNVYNNFIVGDNAKITLPVYTYSTPDFPNSASIIKPISEQTSPQFIDPGILPTSNFRLKPTSPLVGGYNQIYGPTLDLDRISRPQGTNSDIGAFEYVYVTGVSVTPAIASVAGTNTLQLTAEVAPTTATYKNATWTSSNTAVATVSNTGLVKGVSPGNVTITVTTEDGTKTATATITVTVPLATCGLIQNFGFESGDFSSWLFTAGQCDVVQSPVKAGTYAGRISGTGTITYDKLLSVGGRRNIEFKAWVRMDGTPSEAYIALEYRNSSNTIIGTDKTNIPLNAAYTEYKITKKTPPNTAKITVKAYKAGSGNFVIDNTCFTTSGVSARVDAVGGVEPGVGVQAAYPNPVTDELTVPVLDAAAKYINIEINDLSGKSVLKQKVNISGDQNSVSIKVGHLSPGTYLINNAQGSLKSQQVIVKQ